MVRICLAKMYKIGKVSDRKITSPKMGRLFEEICKSNRPKNQLVGEGEAEDRKRGR